MRKRIGLSLMTAVMALALVSGPAQARENIRTTIFRPAKNAKGLAVNESGLLMDHLEWYFGMVFNYANKPVDQVFNRVTIRDRFGFDMIFAISLFNWVELSLDMPVTAHQSPSQLTNPALELRAFSFGDLTLGVKVKLYRQKKHKFGINFQLNTSFPTSQQNNMVGDTLPTLNPMLNISLSDPIYFGVNLGATLRFKKHTVDGVDFGNELNASLGLGYTIKPINLTVFAETYMSAEFSGFGGNKREVPMEVLFGLKWRTRFFVLTGGAGTRVINGVGAGKVRAFLGFAWNPEDRDTDKDGIPDSVDKCPNDPEDKDGFEDSDGCPDPDNDKDGICDPWVAKKGLLAKYAKICRGSDKCPNDPEDKDGFEDEDGCPDPDNDKDGLCDPWVEKQGLSKKYASICTGSDKCPDKHGPKSNNGCPYGDRDGDGLTDDVDKCPDQPGPRENNGCPWGDKDKDGVPDNVDRCPTVPGPKSNQGCPLVQVTKGKIVITQKVFFDTGRATIKPVSFAVLDAVVDVMKKSPTIKKIQIEGHTDARGSRKLNRRLSRKRARAVYNYIVGKGVDKTRLTYKGYGPDKPLVKGTGDEVWEKNRRVEFTILKRSDQ